MFIPYLTHAYFLLNVARLLSHTGGRRLGHNNFEPWLARKELGHLTFDVLLGPRQSTVSPVTANVPGAD